MIRPYLKELAEQIYADHEHMLDELTLVFPNRRAGLFFRQYLSENLDKPIWSPTIISFEDFVQQLSPIQPLDKLSLIFRLFGAYQKFNPVKEGFEQFYYWGEMLLKDFDELDKYLIDAKHLFVNISKQKALDEVFDFLTEEQRKIILQFWQRIHDHPSREKENFIKIWDILYDVYTHFTKALKADNLGYMGMIYRDVVNRIKQQQISLPFNNIVFAGFNALTGSEERIIEWVIKENKGKISWDIDNYYFKDKRQEAGLFFREYAEKPSFAKSFNQGYPTPILSNIDNDAKNVTITAVPIGISQAKIVGQHLEEQVSGQAAFEKTVVVLPEENLLFPVLHALPKAIGKINVTMGFPLKNTSLYSLFEHLIELQINIKQTKDTIFLPHRQVLAILKHPYIRQFDYKLTGKNILEIERFNKIFIHPDSLIQDQTLFPLIFKAIEKGGDIFDYLLAILMVLSADEDESDKQLEKEFNYQFFTQLNRLKEVSKEENINLDHESFLRLFRQLIQSLKIPFTGEPLKGLQIMGVLETRNLDFENVFILSMNEGAFPASPKQHSFIPYNLRKGYSLPTFEHQDAMYGYLFYRLLQRAKNINLYYSTEASQGSVGEMSRYLQQIKHESNWEIKHYVLNNEINLPTPKIIVVDKTAKVLKRLESYMISDDKIPNRLTPSAINTYLDCKLKFYLRHLAKVREPEKMEDEIDPKVFGNILHNTMERLYTVFIEEKNTRHITVADFDYLHLILPGVVEWAFKIQYQIPDNKSFSFEGRNVLARAMIMKFATRILKSDANYTPFEILGLEAEEFKIDFSLNLDGNLKSIGLKGIIDRIDRKENVIRVIDYKTGKDDKRIENIESLFDPENPKRNKAAMQTIFYSLLYAKSNPDSSKALLPGIFNSKEMFDDSFDIRLKLKSSESKPNYIPMDDVRPNLDTFRQELAGILHEIFSREVKFTQTDNDKICRTCPYVGICHR